MNSSKSVRRILQGWRPQGLALGAALLVAGLSGVGCEDTGWARTSPAERIEFSIDSSRDNMLVGETVTLTTKSANLLGRNPRVEWTTSGGKLTPVDNERAARVTFDTPGTYLVEAKLYLNDQLMRSDSQTIKVRPVP